MCTFNTNGLKWIEFCCLLLQEKLNRRWETLCDWVQIHKWTILWGSPAEKISFSWYAHQELINYSFFKHGHYNSCRGEYLGKGSIIEFQTRLLNLRSPSDTLIRVPQNGKEMADHIQCNRTKTEEQLTISVAISDVILSHFQYSSFSLYLISYVQCTEISCMHQAHCIYCVIWHGIFIGECVDVIDFFYLYAICVQNPIMNEALWYMAWCILPASLAWTQRQEIKGGRVTCRSNVTFLHAIGAE